MADRSKIEWTDATWNPIRGCSVVSEGCRNCYAMHVAARFSGKDQAYEGLAYRNDSGAHWTGKVRLIEEHLEDPLRWKRPRRIFVNSMSDLFHESVTEEWVKRIFRVMLTARHHVYQILTKRPERMRQILNQEWMWKIDGQYTRHIWLGVSVENQKTADERIPLLLQTPAAVRWISAEPLLGPVDLKKYLSTFGCPDCVAIDWTVVGGESGPKARAMYPEWARSLRDQCVSAGVPFFFKQWGEFLPLDHAAEAGVKRGVYRIDELMNMNTLGGGMMRAGKKAAGRELDGRKWSEYPEALGQ